MKMTKTFTKKTTKTIQTNPLEKLSNCLLLRNFFQKLKFSLAEKENSFSLERILTFLREDDDFSDSTFTSIQHTSPVFSKESGREYS